MVIYDRKSDYLEAFDIPTYMQTVGKKKRPRLDVPALHDLFDYAKLMGCELAIIEQVGGRPKQSASAAFVFGYVAGVLMDACFVSRIPVETVAPNTWKKLLRVPGGKAADDEMIMKRADDMMPTHCQKWRGPNGGRKLDRAEAAMLAYYGETFALDSIDPTKLDAEYRLVYQNATGNAY